MPRKPRIHLPGSFYHVMLRGNARQDIFFDHEDREKFYDLLKEGSYRYGYLVHAFCLMSNHVHLLLQQGSCPLSKPMQNISFRYTHWINKRQERIGHLFQGRYKAILVEKGDYLLQLIRYIHLNPVKAQITHSLEEYQWSSHQAYLGMHKVPWLSIEFILSQFSDDLYLARKLYAEFVRQDLYETFDERLIISVVDKRVLGGDEFVKKVTTLTYNEISADKPQYSIEQVIQFVCDKFDVNRECLVGKNRNHNITKARMATVWLCYNLGISTVTEVARSFNRDPTNYMRCFGVLSDPKIKDLEKLRCDFILETKKL